MKKRKPALDQIALKISRDFGRIAAETDDEINIVAIGHILNLRKDGGELIRVDLRVLEQAINENGFNIVILGKDTADKTEEFGAGFQRIFRGVNKPYLIVQTKDLTVVDVYINDMSVCCFG